MVGKWGLGTWIMGSFWEDHGGGFLAEFGADINGVLASFKNTSSKENLGLKCDEADFVDVLLSLDGDEKLNEDDMIAVLWEMIFRGTDTTALLTEWIMAELVLHPEIQAKLREELDRVVGNRGITDSDIEKLPYLVLE
ncbi:Uncharacterized protein Fot_20671 [Forsythia ovata]|uniref:Cytochrome P450 n=1 Tax=Forsythia ovata TaxID=205694 RepID=A0ABD1USN2_9LAMI